MKGIELQKLIEQALGDKIELYEWQGLYKFSYKYNSNAFSKDTIHNLDPNSFETMTVVNECVQLFNLPF